MAQQQNLQMVLNFWHFNGQLHRVDGPAIEYANGAVEYWYKDKQIIKETYLSKEFQIKIILEG